MITPVARFSTRVSEGDKVQSGFFMGVCFKEGAHLLKPNCVYEIRDILGELTIECVGEVSNKKVWLRGISDIITSYKEEVLCTAEEIEASLTTEKIGVIQNV